MVTAAMKLKDAYSLEGKLWRRGWASSLEMLTRFLFQPLSDHTATFSPFPSALTYLFPLPLLFGLVGIYPVPLSSVTSWEIDGETVETVSDFIFLGSKITADGDCSHKIGPQGASCSPCCAEAVQPRSS